MIKYVFTVFLILTITTIFAFDELWQKAQTIMENSKNYVPGTLAQHWESVTKKPGYEFRLGYEIIIGHALGEEGKTETSLISRNTFDNYNDLRNNPGIPRNDILDMRKAVDELKSGINSISNSMLNKDMDAEELDDRDILWTEIFTETDPKKLVLTPQKRDQNIGGNTCRVYKVRYMPDGKKKNSQTGTIYLDTVTGVPVLSVFDILDLGLPLEIKLPRNPEMRTYYSYDVENNIAHPSRVEIKISIPFMGITSEMNTMITMGDYWERD